MIISSDKKSSATALPAKGWRLDKHVLMHAAPVIIYLSTILAFTGRGVLTYTPMLLTWVALPLLELAVKPDPRNLAPGEEETGKNNRSYDFILYAMVLLQGPVLWLFFHAMQQEGLSWWEKAGRVTALGMFCGTCAINVGHELGHRVNRFEQVLAKISLLTSLYMYNMIEHNRGHHKNVATWHDPSSARWNESLYRFWARCTVYTYVHTWQIANREMRKKGRPVWSLQNEMVQVHLFQGAFMGALLFCYGPALFGYYLLAAVMGILLLQAVSYIEHYGLSRKRTGLNSFERVQPSHSWDSNHLLGRLLLFEVPRHSDHHYMASRKFQMLRYHATAPQMPTGYPGMMIMAMIPPAWFRVMNPLLEKRAEQEREREAS